MSIRIASFAFLAFSLQAAHLVPDEPFRDTRRDRFFRQRLRPRERAGTLIL